MAMKPNLNMDTTQARAFVADLEGETSDQTEIPANRRMGPISLTHAKGVGMTLNQEARIQGMVSKITGLLRDRVNSANAAEQLSQQVAAEIGRAVPELLAKADQEKSAAKAECLLIAHRVLDFLTGDEMKITDTVMSERLLKSYEQGKADGYREADRAFKAELAKVTAGVSPLDRSLQAKLV